MLEPESTTGGLLRVSRTTLVTVETAKTDDKSTFIADTLKRGAVVSVFWKGAAVVETRELLTPAIANVEV